MVMKEIYQGVINVQSISLLGGGYRYAYICKYLSSSLYINYFCCYALVKENDETQSQKILRERKV